MANCLEQFTAVDAAGSLNFRRTPAACRRVLPGLAHLLLCALCMGTLTPSAGAQWQGRDLADLSLEELSRVEVAPTPSAPLDSQQTQDLTELSPEDHSYAVPGGAEHRQDAIPQDGRSFRVKLNYRYSLRSESPQTAAPTKP